MESTLEIRMLDGFTLRMGDQTLDSSKSRSNKSWLLLAYLVCHRSRPVRQTELYQLLWGDEEDKDHPQNALRVQFHRLRSQLDQLSSDLGKRCILRTKEGYQWAPDLPLWLDTEAFDALCDEGLQASDPAEGMDRLGQALNLYRTDFLPKFSGAQWVRSMQVRYHDCYLDAVRTQLTLLDQAACHQEAAELAQTALKLEPFSESLWFHLLKNLLTLDRRQDVVDYYEKARDLFLNDLGTLPADDLRRLYYDALQETRSHLIPIDDLYDQMKAKDSGRSGALLCDYDFFLSIFHAAARTISRSGISTHLLLLTTVGKDGGDLPKRSAEHVMESLLEQARTNLRRGDIITRCSFRQYAILLQMANYENSCMVCQRIIKAYQRKYPHSPAEIRYAVKTVEAEP